MLCQKSAEAIVGASTDRRAEQVVPKLGRLILMAIGQAEALAREASGEETGRYPVITLAGAEIDTATVGQTKSENHTLIERVVARSNMQRAYQQVMRNHGAPGIDGMRTEDLKSGLVANWHSVKQALLDGSYMPQSVRRVDIPKPNGGIRTLGSKAVGA